MRDRADNEQRSQQLLDRMAPDMILGSKFKLLRDGAAAIECITLRPWKFEAASRSSLIHVSAADAMPAPETRRFFTHFRELNHSPQLFRRLMMETKTTKFEVLETSAAALPTTFVSAEEGASLAKMLELELEQASQVAGGLSKTVRCCACHCCSVH